MIKIDLSVASTVLEPRHTFRRPPARKERRKGSLRRVFCLFAFLEEYRRQKDRPAAMWLFVVLSFALLTTSSSRPPLRETVEVNGRLYHEVSPESHRMLLSLNESELDPRHVFIDQHGRRLATHLKFSPSELESEMVCTQQPWSEAHSLPGWCPQARYPGKYKPC